MTQRIRELALEAGEYVNSVYTPPVRSTTPGKIWEDGHVDWHTQFNQKFAELIVAECCVIVNQEASLTDHVPAEMNAYAGKRLKNAYIKIEQHFGVEE